MVTDELNIPETEELEDEEPLPEPKDDDEGEDVEEEEPVKDGELPADAL